MDINLPLWGYYPKDNKKFIDPLYVPYQTTKVTTDVDGFEQECEVNPWPKQGYASGEVNPALVRRGWGLSYMRMHPDKDRKCPEGWTEGEFGWCASGEPEFKGTLYTNKAFVPAYQYWGGYAPRIKDPMKRRINEFDNRSVNPWTGDYVLYHTPFPSSMRNKYGSMPSKDSLLA